MRRVLPADAAEILPLQTLRHRLPVFGSRIVPLFAIAALQGNDLSGHKQLLSFLSENREPTTDHWALNSQFASFSTATALLNNLADGSSAYRVPAFADGK